jgi:hypothetical protein
MVTTHELDFFPTLSYVLLEWCVVPILDTYYIYLHLPFVKAFCRPFCQKFLGAMDLLSGDLQWGKMMGKPSWWGKEGHDHHQHHHDHIIRVLRTELDLQFICMEFVSWVDCKILLCCFCPANNLQGIFSPLVS